MSLPLLVLALQFPATEVPAQPSVERAVEDGPSAVSSPPIALQEVRTAAAEMERMRFMIGEWEVDAWFRNSPSTYARGSGTISVRLDQEAQVLIADMNIPFDGFTVQGTTLRRFNEARGIWEVEWIDTGNPAASESTIDGQFKNDRFLEINYGADQRGPYIGRLVISDMTDESFTVRKDRIWDDGTIALEIWAYEARKVR